MAFLWSMPKHRNVRSSLGKKCFQLSPYALLAYPNNRLIPMPSLAWLYCNLQLAGCCHFPPLRPSPHHPAPCPPALSIVAGPANNHQATLQPPAVISSSQPRYQEICKSVSFEATRKFLTCNWDRFWPGIQWLCLKAAIYERKRTRETRNKAKKYILLLNHNIPSTHKAFCHLFTPIEKLKVLQLLRLRWSFDSNR